MAGELGVMHDQQAATRPRMGYSVQSFVIWLTFVTLFVL